jgi:hypothetical protein
VRKVRRSTEFGRREKPRALRAFPRRRGIARP